MCPWSRRSYFASFALARAVRLELQKMNAEMLFISGSLGLGHLGRDLDIADALRKNDSGIEISWLAEDRASLILKEAGGRLLPEAGLLAQGNERKEDFTKEYPPTHKLDEEHGKGLSGNAALLTMVVGRERFALVVGDEAYDILIVRVLSPSSG